MDSKIDPDAKPLTADELARDAAPGAADGPVLTEAQDGNPDPDSVVIDRALTNLPPG